MPGDVEDAGVRVHERAHRAGRRELPDISRRHERQHRQAAVHARRRRARRRRSRRTRSCCPRRSIAAAAARRRGDARARPGVEHRERAGRHAAGRRDAHRQGRRHAAGARARRSRPARRRSASRLDDAIRESGARFLRPARRSMPASTSCCGRPTPARASSPRSAQALSGAAAAGPLEFERRFTEVAASGPEFVALIGVERRRRRAGRRRDHRRARPRAASPPLIARAAARVAGARRLVRAARTARRRAPVLRLIAPPSAAPYTLTLTARESRPASISPSRCRAATAPTCADGSPASDVAAGSRAHGAHRSAATRTALLFEVRRRTDPARSTRSRSLMSETLVAQGPQFVSATIVGPETLPAAGPYGFNVALLFDRVVDAAAAADRNNYSMPRNELRSARRQLSGRLVFGSLAQPEHTYVPTTITVAGMPDPRGVPAHGGTRPLRSLLRDPGAVVSGRILNPDGTPVVGATVSLLEQSELADLRDAAEQPDRLCRGADRCRRPLRVPLRQAGSLRLPVVDDHAGRGRADRSARCPATCARPASRSSSTSSFSGRARLTGTRARSDRQPGPAPRTCLP